VCEREISSYRHFGDGLTGADRREDWVKMQVCSDGFAILR
jgi:hypothetical protein